MNVPDHITKWNHCLEIIKDNLPKQAFDTWFAPITPLTYGNNELMIGVPTRFFPEMLEDRFASLLHATIERVFGKGTKIYYAISPQKDGTPSIELGEGTTHQLINDRPQKNINKSPGFIESHMAQELNSYLNPDYTFANFIEGDSNKLPRSVAEEVAERPAGTPFNPLFIYGASGVGKTHLANAIGLRIKKLYPQKRVLYVSAHLFQVQYTDSVRNNTMNDFIRFYQTIDVLIIDDIQEFAGVTKTQNTFYHIFNHLHQNKKQLILTSDRAPVLLQGIEERLLSRFKWGMVAELEKPTAELRKDILLNKIHRDGLQSQFPVNVINYIAENVNDSIRDLEGIVIALQARSICFNKDIDMDLAQHVVKGIIHNITKTISIDDIINVVCNHFGLNITAIHTKSRKKDIVQARQIAMYLAKNHTELSTSKIGKFIGNKDHATVLHACKTVKGQLEVDKAFQADMTEIEMQLKKNH